MAQGARSSFPAWPQFGVFAVAAGYLYFQWDRIPPRWVCHWDIMGRPNGWADRTLEGVFGPLVLGAAIAGFVESMLLMMPSRDRDADLHPVRAASVYFVRVVTFAVVCVLGIVAVSLPLKPGVPPLALVAIAFVLPGMAMALGARRVSAALQEVRRSGHADKVAGYRGLYYGDASDPRLFVPKLTGFGMTVNFGHPWAWPVMILLTGLPIAIVLVIVVATRP